MRGQAAFLALRFAALAALVAAGSLWHHGHIRSFLALVYDTLVRRLPKPLRKHDWRVRSSILQVYFGDPTVHYEVWIQRKTATIEIGLHFEGDREENYWWAQALAPRALEIQAQLGPDVELEEWTKSWTRLHEARALGGEEWRPSKLLTEDLAREVAERLARYIEVLQPVLSRERRAERARARRGARSGAGGAGASP